LRYLFLVVTHEIGVRIALIIPIEPGDDTLFIGFLRTIVRGLIREWYPEELFLIRIDEWFNEDWLPPMPSDEPALRARLPLFRKAHVVSEMYFQKDETGQYVEAALPMAVHPPLQADGAPAARRRVGDYTESGLFVWFNSQSKRSRRGSVIVYHVEEDQVERWFVEFSKNGSWRVANAIGIEREFIDKLISVR